MKQLITIVSAWVAKVAPEFFWSRKSENGISWSQESRKNKFESQ